MSYVCLFMFQSEATLRERERTSINRSLLTLGRVLTALKEPTDGKKGPSVRIPYRYVVHFHAFISIN